MSSLTPFLARSPDFIWRRVDDAERVIEGTASSVKTDKAGDVLEPKGATFELPMPLLLQHDRRQPIGKVLSAKVSDSEITVRARVESGTGLAYVEDAWKQLSAGLVDGLSIGAQPLKAEPILDKDGRMTGVRYTAWRWLELSAVTLPMNDDTKLRIARMFGGEGAPGDLLADITGAESERHSYEATRARAVAAIKATRAVLYR